MREPGLLSSIGVAIPAYEEERLSDFLIELDEALGCLGRSVTFYVTDDASPSRSVERILEVQPKLTCQIDLVRNERNAGHGPTVMRAYHRAFDAGSDLILQVDGDGQFFAQDLALLLAVVDDGAEVASGVRQGRQDPWFRKLLSALLRTYLRVSFNVSSRDPNCPCRAYRREVLEKVLPAVPTGALVPNIYLTVLCQRGSFQVVEVPVRHRTRLGEDTQGTMWGPRRARVLIPSRLVKFAWRAFRETLDARTSIRRHP